jgi:hypothetical protein
VSKWRAKNEGVVMGGNDFDGGQIEGPGGEFLAGYQRLMDEVMPHLAVAEQVLYHRLFRLTHGRRSEFVKCRYEELAFYCGLSLRTLQRALKGLKQKQLVKTLWQSHGATTFTVRLPWELARKPSFLPRRQGLLPPSPPQFSMPTPPVYDGFSPEDRELFLTCKRSLSPERLNTLTEDAVEWLSEQAGGDPTAFSDSRLRDKVDELVFREVFGAERRERYEHLFLHLYGR